MKQRVVVSLLTLIALVGAAIIVAQTWQEGLPQEARAALNRYVSTENAVAAQLRKHRGAGRRRSGGAAQRGWVRPAVVA